jgi:ATP-dependent helicase HrpB
LAAGRALLTDLGALAGGITEAGRRMVQLGAHPRLAAMMLAAQDPGGRALAADLAALLEERDPIRGREPPADVGLRLDALAGRGDADGAAVSRIRRAAGQYRRRLGTNAAAAGDPAPLLAAAFPDRIAQRRGEIGSFRLSGGGGAKLPAADPLARAALLVVASIDLKASARIRLAATLDIADIPPARITETVESGFDPVSGVVLSRRRRRLSALVLDDRTIPADPAETATILAAALATRLGTLDWTEPARQLQARAAWLRRVDDEIPDMSDGALAADVQAWLAPHLAGMARLTDTARLDLLTILRARLGWEAASRLDRDLPTHLALPQGRASIDYTQPVPLASARAQAFYGQRTTPLLCGGRVPLQFALLSPAGRPVAITADLAGFWGGAWADVRRDMRGRYPRHDWPERPGED